MQENAAQRYIQANVIPPDPHSVDWQAQPLPFKLYRNCEQIALSYDTTDLETGLGRGQIGQMLRDIYGLTRLDHSIPESHPMLKFLPMKVKRALAFYTSLLRPVPSGGALFPCELYLFVADRGHRDSALRLSGPYGGLGLGQRLPAGVYHYDVVHHALDVLEQGDYASLLQSALAHPGDTSPAYMLLLSCIFWKDGFKYGAFSYRLQGLDIGTVISQSEVIAHHAGLSTTIHYQFQDKALNDLLGLDPLYESVYAVVEWRQESVGNGHAPVQDEGRDEPLPLRGGVGDGYQGRDEPLPLRVDEGTITESIARWPLPAEVHCASLIETHEAFQPLHSLAPIKPPEREGNETLPLSADTLLDLWEARHKRHSATGNLLPTPLTRQQLSQLLLASMSGTTNDLDGHTDFLQHTLLYCVICRVTGIPAGIYRYNPERHELEPVHLISVPSSGSRKDIDFPGLSARKVYTPNPNESSGNALGPMPYSFNPAGQGQAQSLYATPHSNMHIGVILFPVGNYTNGFAVYGDRWYRMQNMEAGIIVQRLYLAAAALKLGCRASLDLANTKDKQYLSLLRITIAPECPGYQQYEQSLLI